MRWNLKNKLGFFFIFIMQAALLEEMLQWKNFPVRGQLRGRLTFHDGYFKGIRAAKEAQWQEEPGRILPGSVAA